MYFLFFGVTGLPAGQELSKPLSLALLWIVDKSNSCFQGSEEKTCLYSREEKELMERGKGRRTEEFSPFTGKAHHYGGAVPSEWGNQGFLGSSLITVSLLHSRSGNAMPSFSLQCGHGMFQRLRTSRTEPRSQHWNFSCAASVLHLPALIPTPITAPQRRREEEGQCAPLQTENKDKKTMQNCLLVHERQTLFASLSSNSLP